MEKEKNNDKDKKVLYKLMSNAVFGKAMEKLRNRINAKLESNKKYYLKWTKKQATFHQKYLAMSFSQFLKVKRH